MNTRSGMANKRSALKELPIPENIVPPSVISKASAKKKLRIMKTSSFVESFPGRLDWKRRHFDKPVTSTPTTAGLKSLFTNKDVEKCFGFDEDSDREENYSTFISPIPKNVNKPDDRTNKNNTPKNGNQLADRASKNNIPPNVNQPDDRRNKNKTPKNGNPPTDRTSRSQGSIPNNLKQPTDRTSKHNIPKSVNQQTDRTSKNNIPKSVNQPIDRTSKNNIPPKNVDGISQSRPPTIEPRTYLRRKQMQTLETPSTEDVNQITDKKRKNNYLKDQQVLAKPKAVTSDKPLNDKELPATPSCKPTPITVPTTATTSLANKLFETIKSTCKKPLKSRLKGKGKKKVVVRQPDFDASVRIDEASEPYMVIQPSDIGNDGVQVKNFTDLLERYNFDEKEEEEFRIDPKRATVTYPGKRSSNDAQCFDFELPTKKSKKAKTTKSKKVTKKSVAKGAEASKKGTGSKKGGDELDAATREWLEKKNKEFMDILKVNLIVE